MSDDTRLPLRNAEGYMDTTAHDALTNVMRDKQAELDAADLRCNRLIKSIKTLIDLAGFDLTGRVEMKDRKTGRIYR